jgi:hypothetical protein
MGLKSIAQETELSSPFYQSNKEYCEKIEKYILEKSGEVKGKYNSWAFSVIGEIRSPLKCKLKYNKSTATAIDYYPATNEKYLVSHYIVWEIEFPFSRNIQFLIRKKNKFDVLKSLFIKLNKLEYSDAFIIKTKVVDSKIVTKITSILEPIFSTQEIFNIENRKGILKIEMNSTAHHFEIFDELLSELSKFKTGRL